MEEYYARYIRRNKKGIICNLFSMLPIIELRGGIPLGISLGLSPVHSAILSIIGNIIIIPLLLKLSKTDYAIFRKKPISSLKPVGWVKKRSMKKGSYSKKYSLIGLCLFVSSAYTYYWSMDWFCHSIFIKIRP